MADKGKVLVVDDDEDVRELLRFELEFDGYEIVQAHSGRGALEVLQGGGIDLVLLDLLMPDLSGYEVCSRIKGTPATRSLPVLVVTALMDSKALTKAIDAGADEFIRKPFDKIELSARVRSLMRASQLRRALEKSLRECANLQSVKDQLYRLVIHDLRGPVTSVLGAMDLLEDEIEAGDKGRALWLLKKAGRACESIQEMVETLVDIEKMERGEMTFSKSPIMCREFLSGLRDQWLPLAQTRKLELTLDGAPEITFLGDPNYLKRAVGNLVTNAIRHAPEATKVSIAARDDGDGIEISVSDEGEGVPPEDAALVFDPVFQAEHRARRHEGSYGLGLTLVRLVAEGHGGRAWAESKPSRFVFRVLKQGAPPPKA